MIIPTSIWSKSPQECWFICLIYLISKLHRCICIDSDEMNQRNWIISTTNHPISTYDILKWKWDWCQMFYSFSLFFPSFFAAIIIGFMYTQVVLINVHYLISINQLDNNWLIITESWNFALFQLTTLSLVADTKALDTHFSKPLW